MGKKHLLPKENEEFLDRLGLTELDKKVYIAILDGGLVSAGEIQQLIDSKNLGGILESIRDLVDIQLVKKAKGMMPRYYAILPFFKETLSVETEFKIGLGTMLQSLELAKEDSKKNRDKLRANEFPKIVENLLEDYYKLVLHPISSDLKKTRDEIVSTTPDFIDSINVEIKNIQEEINLMLKPMVSYADLLSQKFDLAFVSEEGNLLQYLTWRKQQRLEVLQEAHKFLKTNIEGIESHSSSAVSTFDTILSLMESITSPIETISSEISDSITKISEYSNSFKSGQDAFQSEILIVREQIKKVIESIKPGSSSSNEIDKIFKSLIDKTSELPFENSKNETLMNSINTLLTKLGNEISQFNQELNQNKKMFESHSTSSLASMKSDLGQILNNLNDKDEESLKNLRSDLKEQLNELKQRIINEGAAIKLKLESDTKQILNQQEQSLKLWREKMVLLYKKPVDSISPFLNKWIDNIDPVIDSFKNKSNEAFDEILRPVLEVENNSLAMLLERISFIRAMIEARASDIQNILDIAKKFDYTKTSDTWVVVGLPGIYASLTDLLLRTKSKVTVVTPYLDLELVELAKSLKSSLRVTFVADIDEEKDARIINKLQDLGRINLRNYPKRDLYACIRDSEEIVFGYINENEETVGIRASTPSVVGLLEDRLNETVIRNSKQI